MNLLMTSVCLFIPIIGPIVLLGYQFEIIEALHRDPRQQCLDFDFNRFVNYLQRGVWPFLVSLVSAVVLVPLIWLVMIVPFVLLTTAGDKNAPAIALVVLGLVFLGFLAVILAFSIVLLPLLLRAGLTQDFAAAFDFGFIKDFIAKTWLECILAYLFFMLGNFVVTLAGMCLCFVGVYPASVVGMLAHTHFHYQLYEIYLSRGGRPIPLKVAPATS